MPISWMKKLRAWDLHQLHEKHREQVGWEISCLQATSSLSWATRLHVWQEGVTSLSLTQMLFGSGVISLVLSATPSPLLTCARHLFLARSFASINS